jgi:hypothetical protein
MARIFIDKHLIAPGKNIKTPQKGEETSQEKRTE